ncbi:hypothetical protein ACLK1S_15550 [Escherichia coli]
MKEDYSIRKLTFALAQVFFAARLGKRRAKRLCKAVSQTFAFPLELRQILFFYRK